jgi:hypothetical protein
VDRLCRHDRVVDDLLAGHRCRTLLLSVAAVVSIRGAFGADPTTPCWPTARAKRRTSPRLHDLVGATAPWSWPVRNSTMSTGFDRRATGSTMTTRLSSENCSPRIDCFQICRAASGVLCGVRHMQVDSVGRSHPADPGGRARGITRDGAPTSHPTVQGEGGPVNDAQREAMAAVALRGRYSDPTGHLGRGTSAKVRDCGSFADWLAPVLPVGISACFGMLARRRAFILARRHERLSVRTVPPDGAARVSLA